MTSNEFYFFAVLFGAMIFLALWLAYVHGAVKDQAESNDKLFKWLSRRLSTLDEKFDQHTWKEERLLTEQKPLVVYETQYLSPYYAYSGFNNQPLPQDKVNNRCSFCRSPVEPGCASCPKCGAPYTGNTAPWIGK